MCQMFISMTTITRLLGGLLLLAGVVRSEATFNQQSSREKGGFAILGNMVDPTNNKSLSTAMDAYDLKEDVKSIKPTIDALKAAKTAQNADPMSLATSSLKDQLGKYRGSLIGWQNLVRESLDKIQNVLSQVSERVNKWRTTVPLLEGYADNAGSIIENTVEHIGSFEISDLWDLDQKFFTELEDNVIQGKGLAMSFAMFLYMRKDGFGAWSHFFDAFYKEYQSPYLPYFKEYNLMPVTINQLPNEDRIGMVALMEAKIGMDRLNQLSKGETECDPEDPALDCDPSPECKVAGTCKPFTKREEMMKILAEGFKNTKITTEDMDKLTELIQGRRLQIASKRKVIEEVRARMMLRVNDVLSYQQATIAKAQTDACLAQKAQLFDPNHLSNPKYLPNTCDDVATFKGEKLQLVKPLSMSAKPPL